MLVSSQLLLYLFSDLKPCRSRWHGHGISLTTKSMEQVEPPEPLVVVGVLETLTTKPKMAYHGTLKR